MRTPLKSMNDDSSWKYFKFIITALSDGLSFVWTVTEIFKVTQQPPYSPSTNTYATKVTFCAYKLFININILVSVS